MKPKHLRREGGEKERKEREGEKGVKERREREKIGGGRGEKME